MTLRPLGIALGLASVAMLVSCEPSMAPLPPAAPSWASATPSRTDFFTPAAVLSEREKLDFWTGFALFRDPWIPSPASTTARDGLGPLFNAHACIACHAGGGRGDATHDDPQSVALTLRVGTRDPAGGFAPHPVWGEQIQTHAVFPPASTEAGGGAGRVYFTGEAAVRTTAIPARRIVLRDGTTVALSAPQHRIEAPAKHTEGETLVSARLAPALFGLGLLEAIPEARLQQLADPEDRNGDGVSGRIHWRLAPTPQGANGPLRQAGRFGWKAANPTVLAQTATAFVEDMGITSALRPSQPCTAVQARCQAQRHGADTEEGVEITRGLLDYVVHFVSHVTPPPRPEANEELGRGARLFARVGCDGCHVPAHDVRILQDSKLELYGQETIWPYTDLLLHDMGPGLAAELPEGDAATDEWRTPPLWGLGASLEHNPRSGLLHDGRARNITEAVAWHGGEGARARDRFLNLTAREREALLAFVRAL
ncbi:MAG: di-heme oxidoredictase family protein [Pseudomonadota bacterium]